MNISKIIYNKLKDVVKTYPVVAENGVKFPFCIYKTTSSHPSENKDIIYEWEHEIEITIVDDKYDNLCELCDIVVDKLLELNYNDSINIESISEDYIDDAYVKTIQIRILK